MSTPKKPNKAAATARCAELDDELTSIGSSSAATLLAIRQDARGYLLRSQVQTDVVGALARAELVDKGIPGRLYLTEAGADIAEALT